MIGRALVVLAGLANFGAVAALAGGGDGESSGLLTQANEAYVFEELDRAKALYEQAAEAGSVAAHYYLAHLFELDRESRVRHYEQAARAGHVSAMQNALDLLFYEASGGDAQPLPALDIYRDGTAANPALADEMHRDIDTLTGCVEAGDLDTQRFVEVHGLDVGPSPQSLWRLAEDAANTGRFGVPDARLCL